MADLMSILQANSQPPQGWASVGQALAGLGGAGREDSYNRGMARAAQLDQLVQTARFSREKAMEAERAREKQTGLSDELIAAGWDPASARAAGAFAGSGLNPNEYATARLSGQEYGNRGSIVAEALQGNLPAAGAYSLGLAKGPLEMTKIADGVAYNPYGQSGQDLNVTPVGQSTIGQRNASAAASYASANSSNATAQATRGRLGLAQAQFALQRDGRWNPSGSAGSASGPGSAGQGPAADGGMLSDLNPRQKTGAQSVQRNLLSYAAALTGTPETELRKLSADEIAALMERKGGRGFQGGIARFARNLPGGQTLGDVLNSDVLSYSQGAGAGLAAYENPSGPISNADRETSTLQMPTYLDPVEVQANKTRNFLQSTGYQPTAAEAFGGTAPQPQPQRARNPTTGQVLVLRNGQWVPE